ncbi:c-type cytochrome [Candidatus Colwellia aromaticivorans]|uniref:c-type cytochrome n=1 Tax=Candidatus Colwellia aromaticivorans TaxID=2267621 RepID=UPI000DF3A381|nr:cytochrome c [Candidatus Colwellia aromaticivorans]
MKIITKNKFNKIAPIAFLTCLAINQPVVANEQSNVDDLVKACITCHGEKGVSSNTNYPNLAGQKQGYLNKEIKAFRDGKRHNPLMLPFVNKLSDNDITKLASYFSMQKNDINASEIQNKQGENVRARCISCHGMTGITVTQLWPNLAGQQAKYLQKQLRNFKSGERQSPIMQVIAQELTDEQIVAVAEYYSQQAASQ